MQTKKPKIALIGCGRIGFLLENDPLRYKPCTHFGGAISAGLKINYACDINNARLDLFSKAAGISKENCFTDYKELILRNKPDLVIIATWTQSHADIGILAARNMAKTIVCEKPIASNLKDASRMLEACKKNRTNIIINHERRYEHRYIAAKNMIENGKIGEVKTVHASILTSGHIGPSRVEEGGGPLLHDGTHLLDILRYLFGDIKSVKGEIQRIGRKKGFEDKASAWLKTTGNVDVFLEAGGNREYFVFELVISGTKGKIVIGNGYEHLYVKSKSRFYTGFNDLVQRPFTSKGKMSYFKKEYLEAKKSLSCRETKRIANKVNISSSGIDGYKALEAIHAIYYSAHINKSVHLPIDPGKVNLKQIFNIT